MSAKQRQQHRLHLHPRHAPAEPDARELEARGDRQQHEPAKARVEHGRDQGVIGQEQVDEEAGYDEGEEACLHPQAAALRGSASGDTLIRAGGFAEAAEHLGGRGHRLVRAGQDDERVVHEREVSTRLAPSDLDERLGRRLAREVAARGPR